MTPPTAAIIIIGNEILTGKVHDANSHYLASELRALGVDVRRISVIPDDVDVIAREVSALAAAHDHVFTAGGVGPTHDDVTAQGVARAFNLKTVTSERLLEHIRKRCEGELSDAVRRMAELPEGTELIDAEGLRFPLMKLRNVYIFPGIPEYLKQKFSAVKERFRSLPFALKRIFLNLEECYVAHYLENTAARFPEVSIGSYPKVGAPEYKVMVTLESADAESLQKAFEMLLSLLPAPAVVRSE